MAGLLGFASGLFGSPTATAQSAGRPEIQIELGAHAGPVRRLAVSVRKGIALTASDDKTARIWDLATGELKQILRPSIGEGEIGRMYGAAIHPTSNIVAIAGTTGTQSGGHKILLFSVITGQLIDVIDARGGDIKKLAYSPDGKLIIATYTGDNGLRAFNSRGEMVFEQTFKARSYGMDVSAGGLVAASSMDGKIHLFRIRAESLSPVRTIKTNGRLPVGVGFSPQGDRLVVGYFDASSSNGKPEIFDVESGRSVLQIDLPSRKEGNLMTVAFSPDGQRIVAGGTAYQGTREFLAFEFDAQSGNLLRTQLLGSNSVNDLVPIDGSLVGYASYDGSWGTIDTARGGVRATGGGLADLRGPSNLLISSASRLVGFNFDFDQTPAWFDFEKRVLTVGRAPDLLKPPKIKTGFFSKPTWQNTSKPEINGAKIPIPRDEVGRSLASFHELDDAIFGTSKALYRIGANGDVTWRVPLAAEARAVNITNDDSIVVTAMSDGTIRWWRSTDGKALMALMPQRNGQWVVWTPTGQFDASAGADRNVGWSVNRADAPVADYFSLNRFRDQFSDPETIDKILGSQIKQRAAAPPSVQSPPPVAVPAPAPPPPPAVATPVLPAKPDSIEAIKFPPVLSAIGVTTLEPSGETIQIPFTIRAAGQATVEIRINGRPAQAGAVQLPERFDGTSEALATVLTPPPGSVIQLLARDEFGISEPLGFQLAATPNVVNTAALQSVPSVAAPAPVAPVAAASADAGRAVAPAPVAAAPPAPPVSVSPKLFVLSIGISDYQRPEYQLGLAAKDSRDFVAAVKGQEGQYYSAVEARSVTNAQATRQTILDSLQWLSDSVGPNDVGMLFMAGHGVNAPDGQYYFMPHEAYHLDLVRTGVPEATIRNTLGSMRGKALFFVDTCYAGNALGNFQTASRELARMANNLAAAENGVVVFASSSGRQLSEENDKWGNGAFTKALIEGLGGGADLTRSGRITYKGLDFFISEEVTKLTEGRQTPVTIAPIGVPDFAIARISNT
ncbi:MAG: caspase family protein [Burkholderiaceae bacterium]